MKDDQNKGMKWKIIYGKKETKFNMFSRKKERNKMNDDLKKEMKWKIIYRKKEWKKTKDDQYKKRRKPNESWSIEKKEIKWNERSEGNNYRKRLGKMKEKNIKAIQRIRKGKYFLKFKKDFYKNKK